MEKAVNLLSAGLAHHGLQLGRSCVAELQDGEVLQQSQSFDLSNPRDLLDQIQNQWIQQPAGTPSSERVPSALPVNLEAMRASERSASFNSKHLHLYKHSAK